MIKKLVLNFKNQKSGFTLVELLLVVAIIGILATVSFAGFNNYNKTQKLNSAADNLRTNLNEAKSNALSGYHYQCTLSQRLHGYKLNVNLANLYRIYEVCENKDTGAIENTNQLPNKLVTLPSGVTLTGTSVTFQAVTGIPEAASTFTLTNGSRSTNVAVDASGIIR